MQCQVDELLVCYTGPVNGLCMICELYIGVLHRSCEWFVYDL